MQRPEAANSDSFGKAVADLQQQVEKLDQGDLEMRDSYWVPVSHPS